jgi:hypothetical protein
MVARAFLPYSALPSRYPGFPRHYSLGVNVGRVRP